MKFWTPNCIFHRGNEELNLDASKGRLMMYFSAFSDLHATIEDLVAEGDKVAYRASERATHSGEFMGIPSTGKQITVAEFKIVRIAGGKIVEDGVGRYPGYAPADWRHPPAGTTQEVAPRL